MSSRSTVLVAMDAVPPEPPVLRASRPPSLPSSEPPVLPSLLSPRASCPPEPPVLPSLSFS
jgi:hypothetical protein